MQKLFSIAFLGALLISSIGIALTGFTYKHDDLKPDRMSISRQINWPIEMSITAKQSITFVEYKKAKNDIKPDNTKVQPIRFAAMPYYTKL